MNIFFDDKPKPKLFYGDNTFEREYMSISGAGETGIDEKIRCSSSPSVFCKEVSLQDLIEENERLQEEEERRKLEERQDINNFLRRMIEWVKFDGDWTVVKWFDGKITKVKKQPGETYSKEVGLLWCIAKKMFYQNPNILFEVMREFVGEDPHEPTTADYEVTGKGTFDKDTMQGYLNRLTHWALDVTNALEKAERDEEHAGDMYQEFAEIRSDMQYEYGVYWV